LFYLAFCAVVSAAVGYGFYHSSLTWFKEHKSEEKLTALRLVDAFVTNYSAIRAELGAAAPVPATFRAHSIERFTQQQGSDDDFRLRWVGRLGRQIATAPSDANMAATIEAFAEKKVPKSEAEIVRVDGQLMFRTVYPSLAREQSCVDCHNNLQPTNTRWRLDDVMGAFVIDVPVAAFLGRIVLEGVGLGLGLFFALAAVGLAIAIVHFRQIGEREVAALELGRTRTFLHTIVENMPAIVSVKDARQQRYILANRAFAELIEHPRDGIIGKGVHDLFPKQQADAFFASDREVLRSRTLLDVGEQSINTAHDGTRFVRTKKMPILDGDGEPQYLLTVSEDITERKRAEERVAHMAHHDMLTGLPNRAAFSEQLAATLDRQSATSGSFAVLCLDLARFKEITTCSAIPPAMRCCRRFLGACSPPRTARSWPVSAGTSSR
jgi:PAS domain S-box-containing protein